MQKREEPSAQPKISLPGLDDAIRERLTWRRPDWTSLQADYPQIKNRTFFRRVAEVRAAIDRERLNRQAELKDPLLRGERGRDPVKLFLDFDLMRRAKDYIGHADMIRCRAMESIDSVSATRISHALLAPSYGLTLFADVSQLLKQVRESYLDFDLLTRKAMTSADPSICLRWPYRRAAAMGRERASALVQLIEVYRDVEACCPPDCATQNQQLAFLNRRERVLKGIMAWARTTFTLELAARLVSELAPDMAKLVRDSDKLRKVYSASILGFNAAERQRREGEEHAKILAQKKERKAARDRARRLATKKGRGYKHSNPDPIIGDGTSSNRRASAMGASPGDPARLHGAEKIEIDFIGDVHGHASKLTHLLDKMGYAIVDGAWRHPHRSAIFLGDLIDRGPEQLETLSIVQRMVTAGSARCIMGNHEFNAIAFATKDPKSPGETMRTRSGEAGQRHRRQHAAFLEAVGEDSDLHRDLVDWFKTLPLWIEEPTFRAVHAAWSDTATQILRRSVGDDRSMTSSAPVTASAGTALYWAVEYLLKGPEMPLPEQSVFFDKDGVRRTSVRVAWWRNGARTLREIAIAPPGVDVHNAPLEPGPLALDTPCPIFIGHYWRSARDGLTLLGPQVACLDFSAGAGGPLAAYRFDGESTLSADKIIVSH